MAWYYLRIFRELACVTISYPTKPFFNKGISYNIHKVRKTRRPQHLGNTETVYLNGKLRGLPLLFNPTILQSKSCYCSTYIQYTANIFYIEFFKLLYVVNQIRE